MFLILAVKGVILDKDLELFQYKYLNKVNGKHTSFELILFLSRMMLRLLVILITRKVIYQDEFDHILKE